MKWWYCLPVTCACNPSRETSGYQWADIAGASIPNLTHTPTYSHRLFWTEPRCLKSKETPTESKRCTSKTELCTKTFFLLLFFLCAFPGVEPKPNLYLTFSEGTFRSLYLSRQGCQSDTCGKQGSLHSVRVSLTNTPRTAPLSQLLDVPLWCCTPQITRAQRAGRTQVAELL